MSAVEKFLRDVASHDMHVIRDDGVYRHIRFKRPGTSCMHFDLVTWPGYLSYSGDMGHFVFSRLTDMFQFFRRRDESYSIDMRYWAEKVEAADGRSGKGLYEFDEDEFKITRQCRRLLVEFGREMTREQRQDFWDDLGSVLAAADDGEERAFVAASGWFYDLSDRRRVRLDTDDFPRCQRFTHRFVWCCYALAWGIQRYNRHREAQKEMPANGATGCGHNAAAESPKTESRSSASDSPSVGTTG
jgi:hypothetical protein